MRAKTKKPLARKPLARRRQIWTTIRELAVTVTFVWLFTNHVAQATVVPSESMQPTVLVGDHFFIDKVGFRANVPDSLQPYIPARPVERGDIVALWSPEEPGLRLIKRVVGLPGETVEGRGQTVYIDGVALDEPYTRHTHPLPGHRDDFGPVRVAPDHYFLMGDNRDNSNDSRFWGTAPSEALIGRALFVYWSYDTAPYDPATWTWADRARHYFSVARHFLDRTRWSRTGTALWR